MRIGRRTKSLIHYHFIVFIFGFTSILGALISIDALYLVWLRMFIAAVSLGFFIVSTNRKAFLIQSKNRLQIFIAGFLISLHWITFFKAIKMIGISPTLAMLSSGALMTAILEPFFYKRKFLIYEFLCGVIALVGMIIIFYSSPKDWWGMIVALLATFLGVLFTLINGKLINKNSPSAITFYEMFIGFLLISVYLISFELSNYDFISITLFDWIWLTLLGTLCTAYAITGSVAVMKELNPYTIMLVINMEPIYGIILALIIFGEDELMNARFYLGLVIILFAIISNSLIKFQNHNFKNK